MLITRKCKNTWNSHTCYLLWFFHFLPMLSHNIAFSLWSLLLEQYLYSKKSTQSQLVIRYDVVWWYLNYNRMWRWTRWWFWFYLCLCHCYWKNWKRETQCKNRERSCVFGVYMFLSRKVAWNMVGPLWRGCFLGDHQICEHEPCKCFEPLITKLRSYLWIFICQWPHKPNRKNYKLETYTFKQGVPLWWFEFDDEFSIYALLVKLISYFIPYVLLPYVNTFLILFFASNPICS